MCLVPANIDHSKFGLCIRLTWHFAPSKFNHLKFLPSTKLITVTSLIS